MRLARMICADGEDFNDHDAVVAAESVAGAFSQAILHAVRQVTSAYSLEPAVVILSGHGAFAAGTALEALRTRRKQLNLASEIGAAAARCGPAHALAVLAREGAGG